MTFKCLICAASMATGVSVGSANATVFDFSLVGSRAATFSIDAGVAPQFSSIFQAQYKNVPGTFGASPAVASTISFGASPIVADFEIVGTSLGFSQFSGPTLFTGPTGMPVFQVGSFNLSSIVSGSSVLTISAEAVQVPEPASLWVLIAGACGLIAFWFRNRLTGSRMA